MKLMSGSNLLASNIPTISRQVSELNEVQLLLINAFSNSEAVMCPLPSASTACLRYFYEEIGRKRFMILEHDISTTSKNH